MLTNHLKKGNQQVRLVKFVSEWNIYRNRNLNAEF